MLMQYRNRLDCQLLQHFAPENHESLAGAALQLAEVILAHASYALHECITMHLFILSNLNFGASSGYQGAQVILAHTFDGLCLQVGSVVAVPCFPHFSTASVCEAPSNEPAHFANLLQAIHGIPRGNKA